MLPPGHIAAGYIVSNIFLKLSHPQLPLSDQNTLLLWGIFFSFAPDLDFFVAFNKTKSLTISDDVNHRNMYSHAPIIWLVAGLIVVFYGWLLDSVFVEMFGLLLWLGSWTHFVLDTIQYGIMWLWPWSKGLVALRDKGIKSNLPPSSFLRHWLNFLKFYVTKIKLTFYLELIVIATAIITYTYIVK